MAHYDADALRIAGNLTQPQRAHIETLADDWEGIPPSRLDLDARVLKALDRRGLTTREFEVKLTPLGQRVAQIIAGGAA